jgi:hypothetical protein
MDIIETRQARGKQDGSKDYLFLSYCDVRLFESWQWLVAMIFTKQWLSTDNSGDFHNKETLLLNH